VNLLLYGTTFTKAPRLTELDVAKMSGGAAPPAALRARLADMSRGVAMPGNNERLQFARTVLIRYGIDPKSPAGGQRVRQWLQRGLNRIVAEYKSRMDLAMAESRRVATDPAVTAIEQATVFRDRGLSSDTTLLASYGIEETLRALDPRVVRGLGNVRRVAVVGPGLDFVD